MSCDVGEEDCAGLPQGRDSYIIFIFSKYEGKHTLGPSRLPHSCSVVLKIFSSHVAQKEH